jgi:hypothetical protein
MVAGYLDVKKEMGFVERIGESITRSIRLDKALDAEINREADRLNISVSSLTEHIIEDYLNHHRWVYRSNALTILIPTLREFLEHLDADTLAEIGDSVGSTVSRQGYMMRGVSIDAEVARTHILRILGGHDNWFTVNYYKQTRPYFFIRNHLGEKWITFVEAYIKAFYRENLNKDIECVRVGDNLQILL